MVASRVSQRSPTTPRVWARDSKSILNQPNHVESPDMDNSGKNEGSTVPILEQPAFTPRKLHVVCIGAGLAGLTLAYKIQHELQLESMIELSILEKNSDVGGTWFENIYPGVACDVPAHAYNFPFEPNPSWSRFMVSGAEIQRYIKHTTTKYQLDKRIRFNTKVYSADWNDVTGQWIIRARSGDKTITMVADILINAGGYLNRRKMPDIPGMESFRGKVVHTSDWDPSYDVADKKVAVIGNGASGIQIFTALQPKVQKIVHFCRSPTWISPNYCFHLAKKDGLNFAYSQDEIKTFQEEPQKLYALRHTLEDAVNKGFFTFIPGHFAQSMFQDLCSSRLQQHLAKHPEHSAFMTPKHRPGCRRLSPGEGYYDALESTNADIVFGPISRISDQGIITPAGEREFDLIVCATGFITDSLPSFPLTGRGGVALKQRWRHSPEALFNVAVDSMPNYFMFNGPNAPIINGSIPAALGWMADYMLRWIQKMSTQGIKSFEPKPRAVADYNVYMQSLLQRTVFADDCGSWYKSSKQAARITGPYGGSLLHFKACLEELGGEHFDIEYWSANRFQFMGNGESVRDAGGQGDMAYYMVPP